MFRFFFVGDDHLRESSANLDDIFVSSTDSSSKSLNDSDIQIFYLVSDPCWGNLEKYKNNLLESELRKIYPESGSLHGWNFPYHRICPVTHMALRHGGYVASNSCIGIITRSRISGMNT